MNQIIDLQTEFNAHIWAACPYLGRHVRSLGIASFRLIKAIPSLIFDSCAIEGGVLEAWHGDCSWESCVTNLSSTEIAMNDLPDQLSKTIDARLVAIIHQITDARDAFAGIAQHASRTVDVKLEQVRTRAAARSSQFQKERERVNSKVKRSLSNAKEKVEGWKKSGQMEKIRQYAAQAENYALAAILDANDAIDDALLAAMESLTARAMAEGDTWNS